MTDVLISGAGIAGSTLAYWLARAGLKPTVVERSQGMRSSGNPVDVRGPAVPVVEAMGLTPKLRQAATAATVMRLLAPSGRAVARLATPAGRAAGKGVRAEVEIPRADLASILYEAAEPHAEFLFDDTITALHPDGDGVDVVFDRAAPRRFDLVIGADGLHSTVRRLVFGPERDFIHHLGLYVATLPLGRPADRADEIVVYNTPGRLASVHPARGSALAAFIFRGPTSADFDHRDSESHRRIVLDAYADVGWEVPHLLEKLRAADEFYFDAVSAVRLDTWTRGRVSLAGDAASCVSLLGDGSSLAISAAHTLAESLSSHHDIADALRAYENEHRKLVAPKQRTVSLAASWLVPKTRLGISARNLTAKMMPSGPRTRSE
ncbi:monooxygenase FAD-binding [Catenulispora acidiphila DSM 44928]|uniref:Monooxygenase FAD-binding n=1 Tax=Catenulispora acidiphila (strain DSM 44928 / JCM 14897 / NBRC 102108 / NRRL B-24433 / ID139908) TaxID=479433 RepID=C7Q890_CATAD|nr:FAD-dependent oxidoreductase [Catenulispora acidiphila]ACU76078.1 monooxygenase FAD-binding [Catenulispora acidiphila DSM 44928]